MKKDYNNEDLKIIDFATKGNVIRFYLGENSCTDYWGDDWNDAPYEHNAGKVYDEYIKQVYDIKIPYDYDVLEPCSGMLNSFYSKEDMKKEKVPCIVIYKPEEDDYGGWDFNRCVADKNCIKIYFNTTLAQLIKLTNNICY